MKIGEAYARGYRDCSKLYKGRFGWLNIFGILTFILGVMVGIIIAYFIY